MDKNITRHIREIVEEMQDDIKELRKGLNNLSDELNELKKSYEQHNN